MLEQNVKTSLINYFEGIVSCHNETQRKEHFVSLISQIFPKRSKLIYKFAAGAEKFLKVNISEGKKGSTGFIDSFYGNLVIEFEHYIPKMLEIAVRQLQGYVAKLWTTEKKITSFICIASDGVNWKLYTPKLNKEYLTKFQFTEEHVDLIEIESFELNKNNHDDFYYWLDRVFFRENSIKPTSQMICAEFGIKSHAFTQASMVLHKVFINSSEVKELNVAYSNWSQYLKYTYGNIEGNTKLFLAHSYLSSFTKILMAHVLAARNNKGLSTSDLKDILEGKYFYDLNIRNYVERDFFYWVNFKEIHSVLNNIWTPIFHSLKTYDFSEIQMDFLKDIYQNLVDPEDRHDLGEYYTPDWLCEKIVKEALVKSDKDNLPRLADITCGSGSFLRAAILELRNILRADKSKSVKYNTEIINKISKAVTGFEIHPLAVFIAKTNYMLALEDLISNISEPFTIPIFLCDSLLNAELDKGDLIYKDNFNIRFANNNFRLPITDALNDERFDDLIDYIDQITHTYKKNELNPEKASDLIKTYIKKFKITDKGDENLITDSMAKLTLVLHEKVVNHENTIWSYILRNNYKPIFYSNKFDVIVGNPPWLSLRYIESKSYREELEKLGIEQYGIAPKSGKLRTQMELATIFLAHGVNSYLIPKGELYFVLPRSIFSADHHNCLRENSFTIDMVLANIWDLYDVVPLFNVPTCVLHVKKLKKVSTIEKISGLAITGKLPQQNLNLEMAQPHLTEKKITFYIAKLNDRTAISDTKYESKSKDNYYRDNFFNGATIYPRNYFYIDTDQNYINKKVVYAETSKNSIKNAKAPYKDIMMKGNINTKFIFKSIVADNISPYIVPELCIIHIPAMLNKDEWKILPSQEIIALGYKDSGQWFHKVENSYIEKQKNNRNILSVEGQLNYHNKLLAQNPSAKYWVLYCASGKNLCSAVYFNDDLFWTDHKAYWSCPTSKREAFYLSGILNTPSLNDIIKPFQTRGLLGERDIEKKGS